MDEIFVTVSFTLKDDPARHPYASPEDRARLDTLELAGDTERLLELLATVPYTVTSATA